MKALLVNGQGAAVLNDGFTRYCSIVGALRPGGSFRVAEADTEIPIRDAGIFSRFYGYASANTHTTATSTFTLRKSLADTALTFQYAAAQTGAKESFGSVSYAATDENSVKIVTTANAGTTAITMTVLGAEFTPTDSSLTITYLAQGAGENYSTASTTRYCIPNGLWDSNVESTAKYRARMAFTTSDFYVYLNANARTTDTTFKTRKNGADGASAHTYTAGQTGAKEDSSNSDSFAVGDDFNYSITTSTGTEVITITTVCVTCTSTENLFPFLIGSINGGTVNFNTTSNASVSGDITQVNTTEASVQIYPSFSFKVSEFHCYVGSNTIATSATTATVRINGANSALTVSFSAAETGRKYDSSNTANVTSITDEINYQIVTPNTSGAITFRYMSMVANPALSGAKLVNVRQAIPRSNSY